MFTSKSRLFCGWKKPLNKLTHQLIKREIWIFILHLGSIFGTWCQTQISNIIFCNIQEKIITFYVKVLPWQKRNTDHEKNGSYLQCVQEIVNIRKSFEYVNYFDVCEKNFVQTWVHSGQLRIYLLHCQLKSGPKRVWKGSKKGPKRV